MTVQFFKRNTKVHQSASDTTVHEYMMLFKRNDINTTITIVNKVDI